MNGSIKSIKSGLVVLKDQNSYMTDYCVTGNISDVCGLFFLVFVFFLFCYFIFFCFVFFLFVFHSFQVKILLHVEQKNLAIFRKLKIRLLVWIASLTFCLALLYLSDLSFSYIGPEKKIIKRKAFLDKGLFEIT